MENVHLNPPQVQPETEAGGAAVLTCFNNCTSVEIVHVCVCMCTREENERQTAAELDSNFK